MGAGGPAGSSEMSIEIFRQMADKYEESKDKDNNQIFEELKKIYEVGAHAIESAIDKELPRRNMKFIAACGAHDKETGSARANLGQAQTLFNQGVEVDYEDDDKWTALFHAAGEGHLQVVEWLVQECGAAVDKRDGENCTPLWVAAFNGRRNVVQFLLRMGANGRVRAIPAGEPEQTPALAARRNRHPGIADLLDSENALRDSDCNRIDRQKAQEMSAEEYRESMRGVLQAKEFE